MSNRQNLHRELASLESDQKSLETRFEQYFSGIERVAPLREREVFERRLRKLSQQQMTQTDLRFRYQNLASRFYSYCTQWDRLQRFADEGRLARGAARSGASASRLAAVLAPGREEDTVERLLRQLQQAKQEGASFGEIPERRQLAGFLEAQRDKISQTFGEREVEFKVVVEDGRARIKVSPRK